MFSLAAINYNGDIALSLTNYYADRKIQNYRLQPVSYNHLHYLF